MRMNSNLTSGSSISSGSGTSSRSLRASVRYVMTKNSRCTNRYGPIGKAGLVNGIANARSRTSCSLIFRSSLIVANSSELLRAAEIERANALQAVRRHEDFRMTETVDGVAVSGQPVLFHRPPGELVVLGAALVFLRAIDQVNNVADLVVRRGGQHGHLGKAAQLIGKPLEQRREGDAQLLCGLVQVRSRPCAAGEADLLRPHIGIGKIARQLARGAPEIDLEGERVAPGPAVEHPLQRRVGNDPAIPII